MTSCAMGSPPRLTAASSSHPQPLADDTDPAGSHRKPRRASKRLEEAGRSRAPDQCATLRRRCSGLRAIRVQRWRAADPGLIPPTSLTAPDPRIFVRQDALTPATSPSCTTDTIAKAVHLQRDPSAQRRCAARGLAVALLSGVRSDHLSRRGLLLSFFTLVALVPGPMLAPEDCASVGGERRSVGLSRSNTKVSSIPSSDRRLATALL